MEELLKSKDFWIWLIGILVMISVLRALYEFNKHILVVVILLGAVLTVLYMEPAWLTDLWSNMY